MSSALSRLQMVVGHVASGGALDLTLLPASGRAPPDQLLLDYFDVEAFPQTVSVGTVSKSISAPPKVPELVPFGVVTTGAELLSSQAALGVLRWMLQVWVGGRSCVPRF
jgi:hypothetical protein